MAPKQGSVEVGDSPAKGEGKVRRCYLQPDKLVESPSEDIKVIADIIPYAVKHAAKKPAMGWRELVKMHHEEKDVTKKVGGKEITEKKKWAFYELTDYKWWTYEELATKVKYAASALLELGITREHVFNIYSSTNPRWQVMANACASQGIKFATAYDSLGEEGLEHSINEPEVYGIFTNANLLGTLAKVISKTPSLKVVIYDGVAEDIPEGSLDTVAKANEGIQILTFDQALKLGKKNPNDPNPPKPDDIACIMYTSGSTGAPKGVLISNGNIIAAVGAVKMLLSSVIITGESYIAYLPLAHIFEFVCEMCMLYERIPMGYGNVKTLTDNSVRNCVGDIRAFKPTIMVGVPAVWEQIRKGILAKVKAGGSVKTSVFNYALSAKKFAQKNHVPISGVLDAVVFKAVKQATGGRLRYALSGGASISRDTQEFLTAALVTVLQGYGLTETCAMCAILPPDFMQFGVVGLPVPAAEIKLIDVEDAKYFSTNTPPQGEVLIRGPSITKGYYKREKETAEAYSDDGWFRTGDIGQWNADGTLSIIDRKKNLVKLAGGEYIALERLESIFKGCAVVSNICLHATSDANRPMAIVFPHEQNLKTMAAEKGWAPGTDDFQKLCTEDAVKDGVCKEINATGKKNNLKGLETLQCVVLTSEEWNPQNGLLTAAQKLQRKAIMSKFEDQIKRIYP